MGQAAAAKADDVAKPVDGRDLDQLAADPELAEEDDAADLPGSERPEHAPHRPVLAPVRLPAEGQPEAVDPEAARACGQLVEPSLERLLPGDEAAADDCDDHREGERDARDDEQRPKRTGPQPRPRDAKRRPCRAAHHR
jgi:hypothetical protein